MFDVVLFEPEIPPNTGNVIRLCANSGVQLHLIRPLGFELSDSKLRRAGLDYHEWVTIRVHESLADYHEAIHPRRVWALSTHARRCYCEAEVMAGDALLFGPETRGLPAAVLDSITPDQRLRIPMIPGNRSLNLSNAVAVMVYEAWRRQGFAGAALDEI